MQYLSVNIPFPGLYNSGLSQSLDWAESSWLENEDPEGDNGPYDYPDKEGYWAKQLQVFDKLPEMLWDSVDYSAAHQAIAKAYLDAFDDKAAELLGFSKMGKVDRYDWRAKRSRKVKVRHDTMGMVFEEMTSPREYNFTTDRLFAKVPAYIMQRLFARSRAEKHATLAAVIRERFTSRSGFISYYRNDVAAWLEKPLSDWDHNELGTLLIAAIRSAGTHEDDIARECESVIDESVSDYFESAVDWPKLEALKTEARQEKLVEWIESDPEAVKLWAANHPEDFATLSAGSITITAFGDDGTIPYRCDRTPDLFAGVM